MRRREPFEIRRAKLIKPVLLVGFCVASDTRCREVCEFHPADEISESEVDSGEFTSIERALVNGISLMVEHIEFAPAIVVDDVDIVLSMCVERYPL